MATFNIFSTLTASQDFVLWMKRGNDIPVAKKVVTINGGNGLPNKHLWTPRGVVTTVTEEEYRLLTEDAAFQRFVKRGFITVAQKSIDPEKMASNMQGRDGSAQLVPQDFDEEKAPSTPEGGKGGKGKNAKKE